MWCDHRRSDVGSDRPGDVVVFVVARAAVMGVAVVAPENMKLSFPLSNLSSLARLHGRISNP